MGKLEREAIQQGWCSREEFERLRKITWRDKIIIWVKKHGIYKGE